MARAAAKAEPGCPTFAPCFPALRWEATCFPLKHFRLTAGPPPGCPLRLNLDDSYLTERVVMESCSTANLRVFRTVPV